MSKKLKIVNLHEEVLKEVLILLKEKYILEQSAAAAEEVRQIIPNIGTLVDVEPSGDSERPLMIFFNPNK